MVNSSPSQRYMVITRVRVTVRIRGWHVGYHVPANFNARAQESLSAAERLGICELAQDLQSMTTSRDVLRRVFDTHEAWSSR